MAVLKPAAAGLLADIEVFAKRKARPTLAVLAFKLSNP
jgi:hypothetical protein